MTRPYTIVVDYKGQRETYYSMDYVKHKAHNGFLFGFLIGVLGTAILNAGCIVWFAEEWCR